MKLSSLLRGTSLLLLVPIAACVGEIEGAESLGEASIALASVPAGVQCIHIDVQSGGAAEGHSFPVTTGTAPVTLALGALPTGVVQFTGTAHDAACPDAVSAPAGDPSWIAEPIYAQIVIGLPEQLAFEFRRNQPGSGTADFQDSALSIAPGTNTTLALMADGTLRGWGTATSGELGNNKLVDIHPRAELAGLGLTGLVGARTSQYRGCAWDASRLWCWGASTYGALGDGTTTTRLMPTLVTGPWASIADVEMTGLGSCLLAADGRAFCWGNNSYGQLGRPTTTTQYATPQELSNRYEVLSAGYGFTCGIPLSGTVECWGNNGNQQLGDGSVTAGYLPRITSVRAAVDVAAGYAHACAVRADGTVWCWGRNYSGELGNGTTGAGSAPVQALGIYDAVAVTVAADASCALRSDGSVACWGSNYYGQLGNGTGAGSTTPVVVEALGGVVELRANGQGSTFCATLADGEGRCWGLGSGGQIGDGRASNRFVPTRVDF